MKPGIREDENVFDELIQIKCIVFARAASSELHMPNKRPTNAPQIIFRMLDDRKCPRRQVQLLGLGLMQCSIMTSECLHDSRRKDRLANRVRAAMQVLLKH
jgi:hypothetical protein